jgi:hypothetical protein
LWASPEGRRGALEAVLEAWEADNRYLPDRVARVDQAVAIALDLLGLRRGPVRSVRVEAVGRGWAGRKHPDCTITIDALVLHHNLRVLNCPDTALQTWVHESLHARQPYRVTAPSEHQALRGYEEGLVEGLARLILQAKAGIKALGGGFEYYVVAYTGLAGALEVSDEQLWRELWRYPTGQVRAGLPEVVQRLFERRTGRQFTPVLRRRLQALADSQFQTARAGHDADATGLAELWKAVLS